MSHFTRIQTRLVRQDHLLAALRDLGFTPEVGDLEARGDNAIRARVQVKVATATPGLDVGFRARAEGFEVVADWSAIVGLTRQGFLDRLHQRYAYHATRDRLAEQGFHLVEESSAADGRIHLLLRRVQG